MMTKVLLFTAALAASVLQCVAAERPNIVFIIADDCTFRDIGCYGGQADTPNIDKLADSGWIARAETGDTRAAELVNRYQHRPALELYDVEQDPFEMNNLAADPQYDDVKKQLRSELDRWMAACDDKGQQTEMEALEHRAKAKK